MWAGKRRRAEEEGGRREGEKGMPHWININLFSFMRGILSLCRKWAPQKPPRPKELLKSRMLTCNTYVQGVQEKSCFFHCHLQSIPRQHIVVNDFQSSQRNARVYSHFYWLANFAHFCTTNSCLVLARGRWQNN